MLGPPNFDALSCLIESSIFIARHCASMPIRVQRDIVSANPSVRLSVTFWYCSETNTLYHQALVTWHDTSLLSASSFTKFQGNSLIGDDKYNGVGKFGIFDRNRRLSRKQYEMGPRLLLKN